MSDDKERNQSGAFANLNNLLIVLLAGTLVVTQVPFHETRPEKPDNGASSPQQVDARLWQDPFEAADRHSQQEKSERLDHPHDVGPIRQYVLHKFRAEERSVPPEGRLAMGGMDESPAGTEGESHATDSGNAPGNGILHKSAALPADVGVLAVMVPGGPYFEDGENRRKLRYAVLSGFDAAIRYMPDDPDHVNYFEADADGWLCPGSPAEDGGGENCQGASGAAGQAALVKSQKVVYEWMVYKPSVNGDDHPSGDPAAGRPPEHTESGEPGHPPILILWLNNDFYKDKPYEKLSRLFANIGRCPGQAGSAGGFRLSVRVIGPYDSGTLQDMVNEVEQYGPASSNPICSRQDRTSIKSILSANASVQDAEILRKPSQRKYGSLHDYFQAREIDFYRTITTDQDLAVAVKDELGRRGVVPGNSSRILLIGEWDTLYGWHLPNTFAAELMRGSGKRNECMEGNGGGSQDRDRIYEPDIQCVFRFSYLRGLDGEKAKPREKSGKSSREAKGGSGESTTTEELENADGDSQFDYVRRLAVRIENLDQEIRRDTKAPFLHPIKAIGILGSDVYDKLLILQALHYKFPDAVFFTNGLDSRFLQPDKNKWARNMVMASPFGLELDRELQRDIPPFRDSAQTGFFLATEMALADVFHRPHEDESWSLGADYGRLLTPSTQEDLNRFLQTPRIHEVGRTKLFNLSPGRQDGSTDGCTDQHPCKGVQPEVRIASADASFAPLTGGLAVLALLFVRKSRQFLASPAGLAFTALMALICLMGPWYLDVAMERMASADTGSPGVMTLPRIERFKLWGVPLAVLYVAAMTAIAVTDDRSPVDGPHGAAARKLPWHLPAALSLIAVTCVSLWHSISPGGRLWHANGEPYSLFEGVSMWPTEALRLIALILAGYFIIEVCRFPRRLTAWMEEHFELAGLGQIRTRNSRLSEFIDRSFPAERRRNGPGFLYAVLDTIAGPPEPAGPNSALRSELKSCAVLNDWLAWRSNWRRLAVALALGFLFYKFATVLFVIFGLTRPPYRGDGMRMLDMFLMREFLVPAFYFLLFLVVDAVWTGVGLVERAAYELPERPMSWPRTTLSRFARRFNITDEADLGECVGMRFIAELTKGIYGMIGYPLIVALLLVVARSSYFDNWVMPLAFKVTIGFSLALLIYWDHRLKKAADTARDNTLKSLRAKVIQYWGAAKSTEQGDRREEMRANAEQLERIICMIEKADAVVYKSFVQRPVFLNTLLIVAAMMVDSVDYLALASKLFK